MNCVYRFLNKEGEIIYIGKAKNLKVRLSNHEHLPKECYLERDKIEFVLFKTEDDMEFAERYYIPKYKPKYNVIWSEREISIDIPSLDNKKWIEYGNKEYIMEQIEFFQMNEQAEFYALTNQVIDDDKEMQLDAMNRNIEQLKNKISILKEQKRKFQRQKQFWILRKKESDEARKLKQEGYVYMTLANDGKLSFRKLTKDGGVNYKDEVVINCFDTKDAQLLQMSDKVIGDSLVKSEEELKVLLNNRLKLVLGEAFNKIDGYTKMQLIKYETFSIEETLKIKIDEVIFKSYSSCKKEIKEKGYYYRSKMIASVYHNLSYSASAEDRLWVKWIDSSLEDEMGELRRTDKVRMQANLIIQKIDDLLENDYGVFEETTIIEESEYPLIGEKIPQAAIIRRFQA